MVTTASGSRRTPRRLAERLLPQLETADAAMRLVGLSAAAFDRLAANTRLGERALAAARAVLVDGVDRMSPELGESRQFVTQALNSIQTAFDRDPEMGATVTTTLTVRAVTAAKLRDLAHSLERMPGDDVMEATLATPTRSAAGRAR